MFKGAIANITAGITGGILVLAGSHFMQKKSTESINHSPLVSQVAFRNESAEPFNFVLAAEKTMPTVVHIRAKESQQKSMTRQRQYTSPFGEDFFWGIPSRPQQQEVTGSGVIYSGDGYIVTNNHVVDFADYIEVTLHDDRKYKARLVGSDPKSDLAVLKIDEVNLSAAVLGNSDDARVGDWVLAVGNPFNLNSTVTAGIISAKQRNIDIIPGKDALEAFIQTDAAVNPGNSGGALVDVNGKLIGINSAIASPTGTYAGYSFAIPVNLMRRIADDLIQYGTFKKGALGITAMDVDAELAKELKLKVNYGVLVQELVLGGSAASSGLKENDVILAIEGKKIKQFNDLRENIALAKIGQVINVTVNRNGSVRIIPVKLKPAES